MSAAGRAAKVRTERRLETARHGARLLDRKQHILADQLDGLQLQLEESRRAWETLAREAAVWLRRSAALDGSIQMEAAAPLAPATVRLRWGDTMGVGFPLEPQCELPELAPAGGSSALSHAALAHQGALLAGVRHAANQWARLLLAAELAATRTRECAVEHRWIPRLENELLEVRRQIDAQELEESLRLRWAADRSTARLP